MNKTIKNILIILILFISIAGVVLPKELNNLDEIWNFNFARCIADGLLPYKDFNMVQTPLLPILCGIILKLTFNEMIVMRILAILLMTACFFASYKILERLNVHRYIINLFIVGIYLMFYNYFCIDYNYAVLLISLIIIYIELKYEMFDVDPKRDFWLGILVGSSILFKQTTGLALTVISIFYKLLLVSNKDACKKVFKIIIYRSIGVLTPILLFVIYLTINNIWIDFLDYTIFSISTFSNKISYIQLIKGNYGLLTQLLSILVPITVLFLYYITICKRNISREQKNLFILFCYSVASMVVVYPISDSIHFLIGALPTLISFCYLMYIFINNVVLNNKKCHKAKAEIKNIMKHLGLLTTIIIIIISSLKTIQYLKIANEYEDLKHFIFIPVFNEGIKKIDDYIIQEQNKNNKVLILDAAAAIYMIPIEKYTKDYDLFLKGNLGAKGENGQIEKLRKENNNTIVLILKDKYKKNWQTPENVIEYIKQNWKKIDEIEQFNIYIKKGTNDGKNNMQ